MVAAKRSAAGYRSGFEQGLSEKLDALGVKYAYEAKAYSINLVQPGVCQDCGSRRIVRASRYTPDFFFKTWVIEAKGKFTARDRKRVLALLASNPDLVGRFGMIFMRDNWLTKRRVQRYTDWCRDHGIPCSVGDFKQEWLR